MDFPRQQKLAKEEERATKAAEKAAEEAALKAKQLAHEEELRRKRDEERARKEAARKVAEEERQRKEEERRKRAAEEKEREAERERKRKEREERLKREREEKERRAREEREAKAAAERAVREAAKKELQEREEREKKLVKEREEKERTSQQQHPRVTPKNPRQSTSPRTSSSAQRSQSTNGAAKKILTKPLSVSPTTATTSPVSSNTRPQPQRSVLSTSQPATPVAPSVQSQFPLAATPMYPPGMVPPVSSPTPSRLPFAPPQAIGIFGPSSAVVRGPHALSRSFGSPSPFDPLSRGLAPPIGPPSKAVQNPLASPTLRAPGSSRRTSIPDSGPGPVARPVPVPPIHPPGSITPGVMAPVTASAPPAPIAPLAPIARPTGEASGSSTGSPICRSPSPKVLGSSALAADDDEVVPAPTRRVPVGAVGQTWGSGGGGSGGGVSSRNAVAVGGPWGTPAPLSFPVRHGGSLWGMSSSPEWPTSASATLFPNSFANHISPSSPHSGN